jgi:hypothetical protein
MRKMPKSNRTRLRFLVPYVKILNCRSKRAYNCGVRAPFLVGDQNKPIQK